MDVTARGTEKDAKTFHKLTTRANDGTSWTVATDGIIFLAFPEGYSYYMNPLGKSMPTYMNPDTSFPSTTTETTNNNPSYGETNIPSPPRPYRGEEL